MIVLPVCLFVCISAKRLSRDIPFPFVIESKRTSAFGAFGSGFLGVLAVSMRMQAGQTNMRAGSSGGGGAGGGVGFQHLSWF